MLAVFFLLGFITATTAALLVFFRFFELKRGKNRIKKDGGYDDFLNY